MDMSTPLLLEVAPEIDTLAMSVHPTYFDLATTLPRSIDAGSLRLSGP